MTGAKLNDLTGRRFGMLTVIAWSHKEPQKNPKWGYVHYWRCRCDSGNISTPIGSNLTRGNTTSCGCAGSRSTIGERNRRHGHATSTRSSPTYSSWLAMRRRCSEPTHIEFHNYGGRGIKVCDRWSVFESFLADMGERPNGTTIERIDSNGDYKPGNCRWATAAEQAMNRRNTVRLEAFGKMMSIQELSAVAGVRQDTIRMRIFRGWPVERAATELTHWRGQ